ncbi:MAG: hypothetical protein F6K54_10300 [Okeania sp. SIO3B5]|uniref:hypothetical protein n=1 Tax=Okeania sp. SIO3B5 TaxID=2607811 RepID=UPI0013FFEE50|nr:hypothetical protein [Okeania sp. SIO3B5]NEO53438.1 hypothetical protein [Okeania sp. SIO3B5]
MKLELEEKIELQKILTNYFNARQKPGEHLKSLVNISQIQIDEAVVDYNLPAKELVASFYGFILNNQENLVCFLKVFKGQLNSDSDAILTIEGYIKKLKRSPIKQSSDYSQRLSEKRAETDEKQLREQTSLKIDNNKINNNLIVDYDLDKLVYKFKKTLDYQGVFAFNVSGDYKILNDYIIKRILQELKEKTKREYRMPPISITLSEAYGSIESQIDNRLKDDNINQITDLLVDTHPLDVVLIIWNYTINKQKLNSITDNFLQEIKTKYHGYLDNKGRCLIIIFANVSIKQSINGCIRLNVPKSFKINELCQWFRGYLQQLQMQEAMINRYLRRLEIAQGYLLPTYNTLEEIIDELKQIN